MSRCVVVAVIPARGGSKGIPGKNLLPVAGVPLLARAVRAALEAELVDTVVVSTDSDAIAAAAEAAGGQRDSAARRARHRRRNVGSCAVACT